MSLYKNFIPGEAVIIYSEKWKSLHIASVEEVISTRKSCELVVRYITTGLKSTTILRVPNSDYNITDLMGGMSIMTDMFNKVKREENNG